jgi:uncharacterized membrane protein YkvA (DUF1232 family)
MRGVHPARLATALEPFEERAREALAAPAEIDAVLREAGKRSRYSPELAKGMGPLCGLVKAHVHGEYPDADEDDVVLALAAVLYVVSPWDLTPDYLPDGLRDDEQMCQSVLDRIERTVHEYDEWRNPVARRPRRKV